MLLCQTDELTRRGLGPGPALSLSFRVVSVSQPSVATPWTRDVHWSTLNTSTSDAVNSTDAGLVFAVAAGFASRLEAQLSSTTGVFQLQVTIDVQSTTMRRHVFVDGMTVFAGALLPGARYQRRWSVDCRHVRQPSGVRYANQALSNRL